MTDRLDVVLFGAVVGELTRVASGHQPSFTYHPAYADHGRVALSSRLPLQRASFPPSRVMPYLTGLLPENPATRARWSRTLDVDADDVFAVLAAMGWDCPGAVQFAVDAATLSSRGGEYAPLGDADVAARLRLLDENEGSWTMPGEHWSLGGQQEKFALARIEGEWYAAHGSASSTHILKPGIRRLHHQALVEHVTMRAAGDMGVDVARSTFDAFEDQWAIVVERFDRSVDGRVVTRLHHEDFAQACGRPPERKYESRGGPTLADLVRVASAQSRSIRDDRLALADALIINVVAGAPDGHAKNVSLLRTPDGTSVAPLYDLASGLAYSSDRVDRSVALSVGGERIVARIRRRQWARAANVLDLDAELVLDRVAFLATGYATAFEKALERLPAGTPGVDEIGTRAVPALVDHAERVLDGL
ncbi:MAG: HipA domain-containing protein [Mobilicoccus sp.]|nr:HipA domain-containing protein [Mobilicoccus sp.]